MNEVLKELINKAVGSDITDLEFDIEHPGDLNHGDYSTNVAMVLAKKEGKNPRELADDISSKLSELVKDNADIEKVEVAGPGFINIHLTQSFFKKSLQQILNAESDFGRNKILDGKKVLIEYTDPNPFKQFHIGHLMSNSIGEALSRILEWNGADVVRATYQGDVGPHVAKCIWGMRKKISEGASFPVDNTPLSEKTKFVGDSYVIGASVYEKDEDAKLEIDDINKKVYDLFDDTKENDDPELKDMYDKGKEWSLLHFDDLYRKLGSTFTQLIFESQTAQFGTKVVRDNTPGIFEMSDGAVVYKGEQDGLHTRVFINSIGLPTYEAKDIGLAYHKEDNIADKHGPFDKYIVITADEQREYFKVVKAALTKLRPEIAEKTLHITHGMMRFADGKMSSRSGNIITGESLLADIEEIVGEKIVDRGFTEEEAEEAKEIIAVAATKYSILKQATGKDITFDAKTSVSFEGDSGPYLQYTYSRARSIIEKAREQKIMFDEATEPENWQTTDLEKIIYRLTEEIENAYIDLSPQYIVTFLTKVASEFNSFYAREQILDGTPNEVYKLVITQATMQVLKNGMKVLGVKVPERM